MVVRARLKRNTFYDSIALMAAAQVAKGLPGVDDAGAVMATEANRGLLQDSGLLPEQFLAEQERPPAPDDLLLVVRAADERNAEMALAAAEARLTSHAEPGALETTGTLPIRSLELAFEREPDANLAVISVAGEYAWLEAEQALRHGLHVLLFSDNVPVEQERRLKELAIERGLLLMGPDCGTAVINGIGLGFSNVVPRGPIGIVGASGTGTQQFMCLVAAAGYGISHAIGTGGRDLSEAVGGLMMRSGLNLLAHDPQTEVIVLISKPPAEQIARDILAAAQVARPVVVVFLGAAPERFASVVGTARLARTLTEGAALAVELAGGDPQRVPGTTFSPDHAAHLTTERARLAPSQRYVRALYAGGTLCDEAMLLLAKRIGPVASNVPLRPEWALAPGETERGHTALDLGADEFTRGRPHPMIDPSLRLQYMARGANDPSVAVLLLDIVLGYCAHPDPASIYGPAITRAQEAAMAGGRSLPVIVSLCGTEGDPQRLSAQRAALEAAGAIVLESNVAAAVAAAVLVEGGGGEVKG